MSRKTKNSSLNRRAPESIMRLKLIGWVLRKSGRRMPKRRRRKRSQISKRNTLPETRERETKPKSS